MKKPFNGSTIFIIAVTLLISGCSSYKSFIYKNDNKEIINGETKKDILTTRSIILEEIFRNSNVDDKLRQLDVAKKRVNIEKTQRNFVFNASASAGVQSEYYDQTKTLIQTSIKAEKLLSDNQNLKKSIELLELDVDILGIDTFMVVDKKINELTIAHTQLKFSKMSASLMSDYLKKYEKNRQLIAKAVASGILSKSKSLELQSLERESQKKLTQLRFDFERSKAFIESNISTSYEILLPELLAKKTVNSSKIFNVERSKEIEKINMQIKRLDLKKFKLSNSQKPTTKFETVISSPLSNDKDYNIFSGLSVQFPVKDGGKSLADISLVESQKEVLYSRKAALAKENDYQKKELNTFIKFNNQQEMLVKERLNYAQQRIKEFDLISKSGRSDVSIVAKEILSAAKLDLEILSLQEENELRVLEALGKTYNTCKLYNFCEEIEAVIARAIEEN